MVDLCRTQGVELVHLAGAAAAGLAPALADAGLPTALTLLGGDLKGDLKDGAEGEDLRAALARADHLLAVRPAVAARAAELGVAGARVVLPGVDLDLFRPGDRAAARQALELPADRPILVGVGALRLDKGWLDAVAALRGLLDRDPFLIVAGEGPDAERIAARARFLGLGSRLALPGAVDAATLLRLYQAADVVLLPARDEAAAGCGMALLEAMACGAPVVATPAFSDLGLVEDGRTGLFVPAGDPAALAQAIETLLADRERAAALGAAARRRVEEGFGLPALAGRFMARGEAVPLAAGRPRRPSPPRPQPRIAVFLPTWRCRAWLPRAIESILAQTWPHVDLYVADDASGDVDAELEERFPTVTFLTLRERGGPFLISNLLLAITESELVAFQDADDRSRPDRLAVQVDYLLDREYDACGSWCRHVDVWGDPVGFGTVPEHASVALRNRLINLFFHPTALYRREALDHLGGFDVEASFSGDTELSFRACFSLELGNVQRFLYERTFLPDSLTQSAETGLGTPPRRAYLEVLRNAADAVRRGAAPPPAPGTTLTGRTIERPDPSCIARLRPGRGNHTLLREVLS